MRAKRRQKHPKKRRWGLIIAALILLGGGLLIWDGQYFGIGDKGSFLSLFQRSSDQEATSEYTEVVLTVRESDIYWQEELITVDAFREQLETRDENFSITLVDDNAIKATYDLVLELLTQNAVDYTEALQT